MIYAFYSVSVDFGPRTSKILFNVVNVVVIIVIIVLQMDVDTDALWSIE